MKDEMKKREGWWRISNTPTSLFKGRKSSSEKWSMGGNMDLV
jgi:hypothetical protein